MIKLNVGDKVIYDCSAATALPATVVSIKAGKNAAGDTIDWVCFKVEVDRFGKKLKYPSFPHMAYTPNMMAMMKVRKS